MVFALRIDLESMKGIKNGLPKILKLLEKFNFKASFYLTMGGEPNISELLRYRGKLKSAGERKIKIFSKKELVRMAILPKDFVKENRKILRRIIMEEHEAGIHGWKHRIWTRGKRVNVNKQVNLAIKRYERFFGKKPISFAAPAFRTNKNVMKILADKGIRVVSDLSGEKPFRIEDTNIVNVPITIKGENKTPIIEYLVAKGYSDEEILEYLKGQIKKNKLCVMYIHGLYECIEKINLLENIFEYLKKNKIKVKKIEDIAKSLK